ATPPPTSRQRKSAIQVPDDLRRIGRASGRSNTRSSDSALRGADRSARSVVFGAGFSAAFGAGFLVTWLPGWAASVHHCSSAAPAVKVRAHFLHFTLIGLPC